jgi:hypothetical protein
VTAGGIRTAAFTVLPGLAPDETNGETGFLFFDDDSFDLDSDLTIDIGLAPKPLLVGNLVFADVDGDARFTAGTDQGVTGVQVNLYALGSVPGADMPAASAYTDFQGVYSLRAPAPGSYFVHVPGTEFMAGRPLASSQPATGFGSDDGSDDSLNEDTLAAADPSATGVYSIVFDLDYGTEPVGAQEGGFMGGSDDSMDADVDLSIDLGFTGVGSQANLGIGNLVFVDADGNGRHDAGEGKPGVWMLLYRESDLPGQATPYRSTHTDASGRYVFTNLPAGDYTVHVAADNFKPNMPNPGQPNQTGSGNGPLYGLVSASGSQTVVADDNLGEDGVDASDPMLVGISSEPLSLQPGAAPAGTAEAGFDTAYDNGFDTNYDLTIDFGFVMPSGAPLAQRERNLAPAAAGQETPPSTFATWQAVHAGAPGDDTDADGAANLLEYAVDSLPESGASLPSVSLTADPATGRIDALFIRPSGGRADIRYVLAAKAGLRDTVWTTLAITPSVTQNNDGTETIRYADVASSPVFAGFQTGLVRLEARLDANLDGTAEASAASVPQSWMRRSITERMTLSMPLLKPALFTGRAASVAGSKVTLPVTVTLPAAAACYLEVHSTGDRFEIDEEASSGLEIRLVGDQAPSASQVFSIRAHWTVAELMQDAFSLDDRVMFFDEAGAAFKTSRLTADGWTGDFTGARSVPPGEGLLLHARSAPVTLTFTGAVRTGRFKLPLKAGAQLVGSGYPTDHSPLSLGLSAANGFTSGDDSAGADRLRLWQGDVTEGGSSYRNLFFLRTAEGAAWVDEADPSLLDVTRALLIQPGQAWFILPKAAHPDYQEP